MKPYGIYCDGHRLCTVFEKNPVEALRGFFLQRGYGRTLAYEYADRAERMGFGRVAQVQISHYVYRAEADE
jgi:hypothetical protein